MSDTENQNKGSKEGALPKLSRGIASELSADIFAEPDVTDASGQDTRPASPELSATSPDGGDKPKIAFNIKDLGFSPKKKDAPQSAGSGLADAPSFTPKPSVTDYLAGEDREFKAYLSPYLPQDLIGGSIPHIYGTEDEAVWNAASQACGTEKVHYTYTIDGGKVWYLACPSQSLASNPDSWCPLAAALPGNSEYWDKQTVYLYEQEGLASALRWDAETGRMQVFLGAARTILPRVQSMDANFSTIDAQVADIVRWKNRSLMTEKLSRATARVLLLSGIAATLFIACILMINFISINMIQRDYDTIRKQTEKTSMDLMIQAYSAMQSDTIKHLVRVQELVTDLAEVDGTLVRYDVMGSKTEWEALVPDAFAAQIGRPMGKAADGRVRVRGNR